MSEQLAGQGVRRVNRFSGAACFKAMLLAGLLLTTPASIPAQSVGGAQIAGTVTDPSGGLVPEAKIKAVQIETGQERTTVSSSSGSAVFPNLPVGGYRLEVVSDGFQRYVDSGIHPCRRQRSHGRRRTESRRYVNPCR